MAFKKKPGKGKAAFGKAEAKEEKKEHGKSAMKK